MPRIEDGDFTRIIEASLAVEKAAEELQVRIASLQKRLEPYTAYNKDLREWVDAMEAAACCDGPERFINEDGKVFRSAGLVRILLSAPG